MRDPLVVVGCGAAKRDHRTTAGNLYLGGYHRACRRAAAAVTNPDHTLILSAQHGLLGLDDEVDPYDLRMGQQGSVTAARVREQAETRGVLSAALVVVLAGRQYVDVVRSVWPSAHAPLAGVGGMGKQLTALKGFATDPASALPYVIPTPGPHMVKAGVQVEVDASISLKTGGRYGGLLARVGAETAVVDCYDGIQRRFPNNQIRLAPAPILVRAWSHLGYIDPATGKTTTHTWTWFDFTLADHLAQRTR